MKNWIQNKLREWFLRLLQDPTIQHRLATIVSARSAELLRDNQDGRDVLTALIFALEALERSEDPTISLLAYRHKLGAMSARLHWFGSDFMGVLPPRAETAAAGTCASKF